MPGKEDEKESVLPLLLARGEKQSLPPWLEGRVYADFRSERLYSMAFDLILNIYNIAPNSPAVVDLRESLMDLDMR